MRMKYINITSKLGKKGQKTWERMEYFYFMSMMAQLMVPLILVNKSGSVWLSIVYYVYDCYNSSIIGGGSGGGK